MTTSMPHSLDRRQLLRSGAILIGAGGAMALLGEAPAGAQSTTSLPLQPEYPTSPVDALPKALLRHNKLEEAMEAAIKLADKATIRGYGAVLVDMHKGEVVAGAPNTGGADPSAHAELNVLREYSMKIGNFKAASETVLVTTAEPCPMCATCAVFSGVAGVAYGTSLDFLRAQPGNTVPRISMPQVVASLPTGDDRRNMPVVGGILHEKTDPFFLKKS